MHKKALDVSEQRRLLLLDSLAGAKQQRRFDAPGITSNCHVKICYNDVDQFSFQDVTELTKKMLVASKIWCQEQMRQLLQGLLLEARPEFSSSYLVLSVGVEGYSTGISYLASHAAFKLKLHGCGFLFFSCDMLLFMLSL